MSEQSKTEAIITIWLDNDKQIMPSEIVELLGKQGVETNANVVSVVLNREKNKGKRIENHLGKALDLVDGDYELLLSYAEAVMSRSYPTELKKYQREQRKRRTKK